MPPGVWRVTGHDAYTPHVSARTSARHASRRVQAGALEQAGASRCKQVQAGASRCTQVQAGASRCAHLLEEQRVEADALHGPEEQGRECRARALVHVVTQRGARRVLGQKLQRVRHLAVVGAVGGVCGGRVGVEIRAGVGVRG
eukprot:60061-Prymnesium_polylepis.1